MQEFNTRTNVCVVSARVNWAFLFNDCHILVGFNVVVGDVSIACLHVSSM